MSIPDPMRETYEQDRHVNSAEAAADLRALDEPRPDSVDLPLAINDRFNPEALTLEPREPLAPDSPSPTERRLPQPTEIREVAFAATHREMTQRQTGTQMPLSVFREMAQDIKARLGAESPIQTGRIGMLISFETLYQALAVRGVQELHVGAVANGCRLAMTALRCSSEYRQLADAIEQSLNPGRRSSRRRDSQSRSDRDAA